MSLPPIGKIAPPPRTVAMPLAHVMRLKRAHFAAGGDAPIEDKRGLYERWHVGPIKSHVKGRTDHIPLTVPPGAFVVPADIVSGMGQGNSEAGHAALQKRFSLTDGAPHYVAGSGVKIMAAGGEHVISPDDVRRIGKGNLDKGHDHLDAFVVEERKKLVKTLRKLPGPAKGDR